MAKLIDYYFTPISPFTYLGHERFVAIAAQARRDDRGQAGRLWAHLSGLGRPAASSSARRSARPIGWSSCSDGRSILAMPLNVQAEISFRFAGDAGCALDPGRAGGQGDADALRSRPARWLRAPSGPRSATSPTQATLACDRRASRDSTPARWRPRAASPDIAARYDALTQEAIDRQVFGAPTYVYRDELFWGQDRLDFLDRGTGKIACFRRRSRFPVADADQERAAAAADRRRTSRRTRARSSMTGTASDHGRHDPFSPL